ncbi:MAG TPA: hypothetical protein VF062_01475 [Candidatus Limnocylindrales bacterium]
MVEIVLGVAVFVLAIAVVGLFAMMGELSSKVSDRAAPSGLEHAVVPHPHPVPEAKLGVEPAEWPDELAAVRDAERAHVVVFGSTCLTCGHIASGETGPLDVLAPPLAIVVACPGEDDGIEFVTRHPMVTAYPVVLDVGAVWLTRNFEMGTSPGVMVFANGRLESAHTFTSAAALKLLPADAHAGR